ncbi:acyl-CoA dehydrogenase [Sorangium cellulosum]|uniref:Acyl-CoA dehydrogenase n=1 Tax=Sorangium cellulosum TaxID=56 RepID=A0A2L0F5G8_SORCE|nr:acyl-CoA dehydrogenase family protein [Sorangium cellulosum]AUX46777.1 acyl-CoA dehydrogenase [Sorangium cellulosum]
MDFGWTPAQRAVADRMCALGAEADAAAPEERMGVLARGGALGLPIARALGGEGLDLVTTALAYEGLGATLRDGGVLLAAGAHLFGVALLVARVGTAEQQRAWLPRMACGDCVATVAATEAGAGSDVAAVQATADRTAAGGYRLTGEKRYVTWADRADVYLAVARAGGEGRATSATRTAHGLTALLVPRAAAPDGSVRPGAPLATAGLRGARLAPVSFSGCELGPDALLGRAGAGLAVFQIAMTYERALILAFRLGAMERALGEAVRFARERELGGQPIARHQAVAHRIAQMKLRLETSRLLIYRAAWALDQGDRAQADAALAKWHAADSAVLFALDALHLRGGAGYLEESGLPSAVDDALGGSIHSGTSDVLATVVARWLGL